MAKKRQNHQHKLAKKLLIILVVCVTALAIGVQSYVLVQNTKSPCDEEGYTCSFEKVTYIPITEHIYRSSLDTAISDNTVYHEKNDDPGAINLGPIKLGCSPSFDNSTLHFNQDSINRVETHIAQYFPDVALALTSTEFTNTNTVEYYFDQIYDGILLIGGVYRGPHDYAKSYHAVDTDGVITFEGVFHSDLELPPMNKIIDDNHIISAIRSNARKLINPNNPSYNTNEPMKNLRFKYRLEFNTSTRFDHGPQYRIDSNIGDMTIDALTGNEAVYNADDCIHT